MTTDPWAKPQEIDPVSFAFPASVTDLMPPFRDLTNIPRKWVEFQRDWFYFGLQTTAGLVPKAGIDKTAAMRHLSAIQRSFEPKHEHKEAAVAYLASRWFEDTSTWERVK